jgi:hypothetical protein
MSHDDEREPPRYRALPKDQTMQLDSLGDEYFEDIGRDGATSEEPDEEPQPVPVGTAPPPLPKRRSSPMIYLLAAVVVLVAIGLGVGLGSLLTSGDEPEPMNVGASPGGGGAIQLEDVVIEPGESN